MKSPFLSLSLRVKAKPFAERRHQGGQVAIFVALIFQVLFLFFAMVVNVGLLVHHKINLQNSVDLAAYYGAMKEAETLNAMAHINYQIRQSWKLLTWRYRVYGASGDESKTPYNFNSSIPSQRQMQNRWGVEGLPPEDPTTKDSYSRAPAFCIEYEPWDNGFKSATETNMCKTISTQGNTLPLLNIPPIFAGFIQSASQLQQLVIQANQKITKSCTDFGANNYATLARYIIGFKFDQMVRKQTLLALARSISNSDGEAFDLDGDSVNEGAKETLMKNLTAPNAESVKFRFYNGLGNERCKTQGNNPRFLNEIRIDPVFAFMDSVNCGIGNQTKYAAKVMGNQACNGGNNSNCTLPSYYQSTNLKDFINQAKDFVVNTNQPNEPMNLSLGYEKNPWCMAYVGVYAETEPKIPFSPLGSIKLRARAYAKPFGGRFGPWFYQTWAPGSYASNPGAKTDDRIPTRVDSNNGGANTDPNRSANYSRFPGDNFGLMSMRTMGAWARALSMLDPRPNWRGSVSLPSLPSPFQWNTDPAPDASPNVNHFNGIMEPGTAPEGDVLAWNTTKNVVSNMRYLEIAAVAPDVFDTTYYSIDLDFYNNYYKRIKDLKLLTKFGFPSNLKVRSDLGSRIGVDTWEKINVRHQIAFAKQLGSFIGFDDLLPHQISNPEHLLTSWVQNNPGDFTLDPGKFGKCGPVGSCDVNKADVPLVDGSTMGRTGYSVKLISPAVFDEQGAYGGPAASEKVMNPPPDDFAE